MDVERNLNTAVNKIRELPLSDSAETPRFIETLSRRGYRFIAPVETDLPLVKPGPDRRADRSTGKVDKTIQALAANPNEDVGIDLRDGIAGFGR